ncbi:MAG: hypothetical protein HOI42_14310 [Candidatus Marinimicrobia bacterium]|jgi:uncharacterized protein (DUF2062 family)|nr:hypothetical protein [Candidatus Neomarinimicrobiota bacterium]
MSTELAVMNAPAAVYADYFINLLGFEIIIRLHLMWYFVVNCVLSASQDKEQWRA